MRGRPATYPWKKWFDRKSDLILKPKDYHCKQSSMCVMIRQQARLHRVGVSVLPQKDGSIRVVILFK